MARLIIPTYAPEAPQFAFRAVSTRTPGREYCLHAGCPVWAPYGEVLCRKHAADAE